MTPRQQLFVQEYLIDCDATEAAKRAGYSIKTAKSGAQRLLKNLEVVEAVKNGRHVQNGSSLVDREYVIIRLREVVERCMQKAPVVDARGRQMLDQDQRAVWAFDADGATRALELLGRHLGMFGVKEAE